MAQRIVRLAHEGIRDAHQLVAAARRHGARALAYLRVRSVRVGGLGQQGSLRSAGLTGAPGLGVPWLLLGAVLGAHRCSREWPERTLFDMSARLRIGRLSCEYWTGRGHPEAVAIDPNRILATVIKFGPQLQGLRMSMVAGASDALPQPGSMIRFHSFMDYLWDTYTALCTVRRPI
jgi:hypothetical protein